MVCDREGLDGASRRLGTRRPATSSVRASEPTERAQPVRRLPAPAWARAAQYHRERMRSLKEHVRGGRLVLDEPTDLPEGADVELVALDDVLASGGDYLDDEERRR